MSTRPILPPVLVPLEHLHELESLNKTELIDLCWWICVSRGSFLLSPLEEFRLHRDRVLAIRATEDWHLRKEKKACAHAIPVQPSE